MASTEIAETYAARHGACAGEGKDAGHLTDAANAEVRRCTLALQNTGDDPVSLSHIYSQRCLAHLTLRCHHEALGDADAAALCRPRWPPAHLLLARCYESAGQLQQAVNSYKRAAELDPSVITSTRDARAALQRRIALRCCRAVLGGAGRPTLYDAALTASCGRLGNIVATAAADGIVSLWCSATGVLLQTLDGHSQAATVLAWSPCDTFLASGSLDGTARLWKRAALLDPAQPPLQLHAVLKGHRGRVSALAYSPDRGTLATASPDASVRLWAVADGACLHELSAHSALVSAISFSRCGTLLATASGDGVFRLWEARSGRGVQSVAWESGPVTLCAFLPADTGAGNAGLLLTAHAQLARQEGRVLLWDVLQRKRGWVDGQLVAPCKTIDGLQGRPTAWDACHGPDGVALLAVACSDGTGRVWDITGAPVPLFTFHVDDAGDRGGGGSEAPAWHAATLQAAAHSRSLVAFSPGGGLLAASGGAAHDVLVLDAESGRLVQALAGHAGVVRALRWVDDGELLSADEDGTARLWRVSGGAGDGATLAGCGGAADT